MERSRLRRALLPALLLPFLAGCTEEALTGTDPESAPGQAAPTVELTVPVAELPVWADTTVRGFSLPVDAEFLLAADDSLRSRVLLRFADVPDSLGTGDDAQPLDSIAGAAVRISVDSARSSLSGDSALLELYELRRGFDDEEATWRRASRGEPWDSAGGDLGALLGTGRFALGADTVRMPLIRPADSLVAAWQELGAPPPMALLLRGPGRVFLDRPRLQVRGVPAEEDSAETLVEGPEARTFIFDPPQGSPGRDLRVGGLPASRVYFSFLPPDTVEGFPLRAGAQINRAELIFRPLGVPPGAHRLRDPFSLVPIRLLADPFRLGARTPVGAALEGPRGRRQTLLQRPEALAAGEPLRVNLTSLLTAWADAPPDSISVFHLGLRAQSERTLFGYWEFGSAESAGDVRPVLRLLVTPPTDFSLP